MASKRYRARTDKRRIVWEVPESLAPQDYSDRTLMNKPFEQVNGFDKPPVLQQERSGEVEMHNSL